MINAAATILRVREAFGFDTVLVEEVGGFGRPDSYFSLSSRVVKSSGMATAGVDSFWKVTGERAERHALLKHEKPYRPGSKSQSYSAYNHKSPQPILSQNTPLSGGDVLNEPNPEQVTYRSEIRLEVGYSHPLGLHAKALSMMTGTGLLVPSKQRLVAVEVSDGFWLKEAQLDQVGNFLFAPELQKHAVAGQKLVHQPQTITAGGGLVVFLEPLQWCEVTMDCRSEDEISADASEWLEKLALFDGHTRSSDEIRKAVNTLQSLLAGSANDDEFAGLAIAIRAAQAKPQLSRLLPELLRNDSYWREQVQTTIEKAVDLKRGEIDAAFADEIAQKEGRLEQLIRDVADAERRLTSAEERERAYRAGVEDVRKLIESQVSEVTRDLYEPALKARLDEVTNSSDLEAHIENIAARLGQIEQTTEAAADRLKTETPTSPIQTQDSKEQRSFLFQDLGERTAIGSSDLAFILARMFAGGFPVLAGENADTIALEIGAMLGGTGNNVVFCDPTKVTFGDLLDDNQSHGSLAAVIALAKKTPKNFVPLILSGLTKSPCEFWLPALLDGRRTGALPKNIVVLGTVSPDGIRVEMPRSLLRRIEPLEVVGSDELPPPSMSEEWGLWPILNESVANEYSTTAIEMLTSFDADGKAVAEAIKNLSVLLAETECNATDVSRSFEKKLDWIKSLSTPSSDAHPLLRYFTNFEG
tara:strand:+ start:14251 stop:16347 length:2097 start_codon:yes stop_codon:yes gene_type:complete